MNVHIFRKQNCAHKMPIVVMNIQKKVIYLCSLFFVFCFCFVFGFVSNSDDHVLYFVVCLFYFLLSSQMFYVIPDLFDVFIILLPSWNCIFVMNSVFFSIMNEIFKMHEDRENHWNWINTKSVNKRNHLLFCMISTGYLFTHMYCTM